MISAGCMADKIRGSYTEFPHVLDKCSMMPFKASLRARTKEERTKWKRNRNTCSSVCTHCSYRCSIFEHSKRTLITQFANLSAPICTLQLCCSTPDSQLPLPPHSTKGSIYNQAKKTIGNWKQRNWNRNRNRGRGGGWDRRIETCLPFFPLAAFVRVCFFFIYLFIFFVKLLTWICFPLALSSAHNPQAAWRNFVSCVSCFVFRFAVVVFVLFFSFLLYSHLQFKENPYSNNGNTQEKQIKATGARVGKTF